MARWKDTIGEEVEIQLCDNAFDYVKTHLDDFKNEGGLLLLIYSAVLTKGV